MVFRLRDFVHPRAIWALRRELDRAERAPLEQRQQRQLERLRRLLRHARDGSSFWRERLERSGLEPDAVRHLDDLGRLPLLDKDEVRRHGEAMRVRDGARYRATPSQTSGSTGTALSFLLDRPTAVLEFATLWRQFNWAGYRFGQRFADLRGHVLRSPTGIERDLRLNALNLSAFHLTTERVPEYAAALVAFAPVMVRGYPSTISLFSSWALELGVTLPSPRAVVTSSETLLEPQRRVIERAFRAPVFDYYGQMERVAFAGQCPLGAHHVLPEYGLVELLDDAGSPVPPGRPGRLVATGLHHRAMPFIRYETRDVASWAQRPCPCGRTSPTFAQVHGRLEDFIVTPDGRHVGRLDAAFQHSPGIRRARIVQESADAVRIEVLPGRGYGPGDEDRLRRELRARLGDAIAIEIAPVAELALDRSGKLKFVVSNVHVDGLPTAGELSCEAP